MLQTELTGRAFGAGTASANAQGQDGIEQNRSMQKGSDNKVKLSHEIFLMLLAARIIIRPIVRRGEDAFPGVTHSRE